MQLSLILISILGLAAATPVDFIKINEALLEPNVLLARNSALENLVLGLLDDLRKTMLTGSNDVPVLDPFELDHLHLDQEILTLPGSHVDVTDLRVSKLSTFVMDKLTINTASIFPIRYRLEFDIHIPVLEALAENYDLMLSAAGTNIFGNGNAKVDLIELRVKGTLVVGPRVTIASGLFLQITSSNVQLSLKGFQILEESLAPSYCPHTGSQLTYLLGIPQINGLMNDPGMSDFINTFLKHFVPEVLEIYEDEVTTFLSDTVQEVGNKYLRDLNVAGILG